MHTILMVDADEKSRRLCRRHLEADGCRVLVAGTKDEVAATAGDRKIDLVIMDLNVPGLDAARCLAQFWNRDVPVIMHTTAVEFPDDIPFWLPEAWLRKTGDPEEIGAAVAEALRKREERDAARLRAAPTSSGAGIGAT